MTTDPVQVGFFCFAAGLFLGGALAILVCPRGENVPPLNRWAPLVLSIGAVLMAAAGLIVAFTQ